MSKQIDPGANIEPEPDPSMQFELAWQLPYVVKNIYSQLEMVANAQLAQFGIGIGVWRILAALWNNEELTNRELARYISIDVTNLSRVSRAIQREGLIRRRRTIDDQRSVRIRLTKKGKDLVERIIPHAMEWQKEVVGDFSAAEMATLMTALNRVAANLKSYAEHHVKPDDTRSAAGALLTLSSARKPAARKSPAAPRKVRAATV